MEDKFKSYSFSQTNACKFWCLFRNYERVNRPSPAIKKLQKYNIWKKLTLLCVKYVLMVL